METTVTLCILVLFVGACQSHSLHFKSLINDVVPEIKEKVAASDLDLKHLKLKLPDSLSGLHIPAKAEDLDKLKHFAKHVKEKLPADLQHLDLKDLNVKVKPILKGLERELSKDLKFKGTSGGCSCEEYKCSCCEHLEVDIIKLDDTVCAAVAYLPADIGVGFTLTVNGKTYINKSISVTNPPALCVGIPGLEKYASICIKFSDLHVDKVNKKFSGCISVVAKLKFLVVEDIKIGCFNMPIEGATVGDQMMGNISNKTQMSKEDQMKMLSRVGLMGKTYNNGRLINNNLLNN